MTMAGLPSACREVLAAAAPGGPPVEINIPLPPPRPVLN